MCVSLSSYEKKGAVNERKTEEKDGAGRWGQVTLIIEERESRVYEREEQGSGNLESIWWMKEDQVKRKWTREEMKMEGAEPRGQMDDDQ